MATTKPSGTELRGGTEEKGYSLPRQNILDGLTDAIMVVGASDRLLYLNPAGQQIAGIAFENSSGKSLGETLPEASKVGLEEACHRARREHVPVAIDYFHEPTGQWFEIHSRPMEEGVLVLTFRDITKHKCEEAALRRHNEKLSNFVESASIGLHWVGEDGVVRWANRAELELLGYSREEYVGSHITKFHADQPVIEDILQRLSRGERLKEYPARMRCKDGTLRHVLIDSSVFWENDQFIHTQCFTRDITARHWAEQRLLLQYGISQCLAASQSIPELSSRILQLICKTMDWDLGSIWLVNKESQQLQCANFWHQPDEAMAEFIDSSRRQGFSLGVGLPGRVWSTKEPLWISDVTVDSNFPRDAAAAKAGLHGAFGFPICVEDDVIGVMEFFSKKVRYHDEDFLRTINASGNQIGQFVQRKWSEEALQAQALELERRVKERTAELEKTVAELEAFSYSISHDLRAPLRAMRGYTDALSEDCEQVLGTAGKSYLERINQSVVRMEKLIQDVLTYTRTSHDKLTRESIDLDTLIQTVRTEQTNVQLGNARVHVHSPLGKVLGHEASLTQCVSNLLSNAVKFVAAGTTPRVDIWTEPHGSEVRVCFADNGIGISLEQQNRLFGMFQRVHSRTEYEGTGLGLAIVQKAVERMDGTLDVESSPGKGSTFWFQLPAG